MVVLDVVKVKRRRLLKSLAEFRVQWLLECGPRDEWDHQAAVIARRYSHSAVLHDNSMYVFGGCTNSLTTFNDLWRLELGVRRWVRPLATGTYPSPKACSSLVCFEDTLVLFGGWAYPCSYPFHQAYQLFSELHLYHIPESRWHSVSMNSNGPPPTAGHSVSVHGQHMVLFGGMQRHDQNGPLVKSNDVWLLDLKSLHWHKVPVQGTKPRERYGHSQTSLNEKHALIMGGCGGPNGLYTDVWLLEMGSSWKWREIEIQGSKYAPPDTWCHPTCRVGDYIVVLNPRSGSSGEKGRPRWWTPCSPLDRRPNQPPRIPQNDENVNGRRGVLGREIRAPQIEIRRAPMVDVRQPDGPGLSLAAFRTNGPETYMRVARPHAISRRELQLEGLRRAENQLRGRQAVGQIERGRGRAGERRPQPERRQASLSLYLLDVSDALNGVVRWIEPHEIRTSPAPEETLLYTLIHGKGELVMFGGIQKDQINLQLGHLHPGTGATTKVSNSLHFLIAPNDVI